jgi:photosystem II stability/assembly factor-like uncharacterized protein
MTRRAKLLPLLSLFFATSILAAPVGRPEPQDEADAVIAGLPWRLIGPFRGGRVLAVAGVPGEREHFYFGSVNGGVWETTDAGRTWKPIFDDMPIASIGAIAVAPSDPKVIYVGTGEADMRNDISQGEGLYKSGDGGRTWSFIGLADTQQIARILVDPADANRVFVAALGHPYGPNAERGVFASRDGGKSWEKVLGSALAPDDTGAIDLAFEPGRPQVIYAALWQTRRTPWNIYPPSTGPGTGLWKSVDGGAHWRAITGYGFPAAPGRIGIAVAPGAPERVYAIVDGTGDGSNGGLYRSDDAGTNWTHVSSDPRIWGRGWYFGGIKVDPRDADHVYALNTILLESHDGGRTFVPTKGDPTGDDFHEMWIDESDPARRILGVDQGAIVTLNDGLTWSSWLNQPTGQFYTVSTDNRFPFWVYGSQQDSGAAAVPSRTTQGDGINMTHFRETTAGGENDNIAPDPLDPQIIFGGRVEKLDLRTEQTRSVDPTLAYPDHYRSVWTLPLVFSHRDPRVLYFGNQRLFRTSDGGEHWTVASPDLTREDPGTPANLDPPTAAHHLQIGPRRGVIFTIGPSRLKDGEIWIGTDDGLVWRTLDEGVHWENVTPPTLTGWSKVACVEPSHHDAETAYVAIDRHRLDDFSPYLYRTHDGGRSWTLAAAGIPRGSFLNCVREDPQRRGLLYAATERGVYLSLDDGDSWRPLQTGLPVTSVRDLEVHGDDLVIATHGRAFWILDDVTPLRQLEPSRFGARDGPARLFAPSAAVRLRPAGFTGTPFPAEEPAAKNPPFGAAIDYYLPRAADRSVELELRDAGGRLVRRYSSADRPKPADLAKIGSAPEWHPMPVALEATAGFHRFYWPIHHAAPAELAKGSSYTDGVWASPGEYQARLLVDGVALDQAFTVKADPRVSLTADDYRAQFELARETESERVRLARVGKAIDGVLEGLATTQAAMAPMRAVRATGATGATGVMTETRGGRLVEEVRTFRDRLLLLAGKPPAGTPPSAWWMGARERESVKFVESRLEELAKAIDGADAAPSPDARAGLAAVRPLVDSVERSWRAIVDRELPALERRLRAAGLPAIGPGSGPKG